MFTLYSALCLTSCPVVLLHTPRTACTPSPALTVMLLVSSHTVSAPLACTPLLLLLPIAPVPVLPVLVLTDSQLLSIEVCSSGGVSLEELEVVELARFPAAEVVSPAVVSAVLLLARTPPKASTAPVTIPPTSRVTRLQSAVDIGVAASVAAAVVVLAVVMLVV
jgi:hypothetical protein